MSDHAIVEEDDALEYHSSLNLALDGAGFTAFKWLLLGHVLFALGLLAAFALHVGSAAIWVTPLFALPLLWRSRDYHLWQKALVMLVGFTLVHYLAGQAAMRAGDGSQAWMAGLVGGGVGAAGSLALLAIFGLLRKGPATAIFVLFGVIVLALIGAMGMYLSQTTGDTSGVLNLWVQALKTYTPWQVVFAFVLAHTLRPDAA